MGDSIKVVMVGGGVMGGAIVEGLLGTSIDGREIDVTVVESDPQRAQNWRARARVQVAELADAARGADVVFLAVKPHQVADVLAELSGSLEPAAAVVSIAAGIPLDVMQAYLAPESAVVRVMPNTPTRIGKGVMGMTPGPGCTPEQVSMIKALVDSVATVVEVPEELQDALTATSGSGPAYVFYLAEAMRAGAQELGLDDDIAITLVAQTIAGAAELLLQDPGSARELRDSVTSKGGTTAKATAVFDDSDLVGIVTRAMTAARDRAREMADEAR